jgi:hypothetical protein
MDHSKHAPIFLEQNLGEWFDQNVVVSLSEFETTEKSTIIDFVTARE